MGNTTNISCSRVTCNLRTAYIRDLYHDAPIFNDCHQSLINPANACGRSVIEPILA